MQADSFNPKHCARRIQVWTGKLKGTLGHTQVYFCQGFTFIVLGYKLCYMDTQTSSRRARVMLVQEQEVTEDWRWPRNERQISTCCRSERLWNKGARKWRERGRARHTVQTASERQAISQWKSTSECGAETLRREKRRTEVQRYGTLNKVLKMWRNNPLSGTVNSL